MTKCSSLEELTPSAEWLSSKQNADGGFGEDHRSFIENTFVGRDSTVMQTSYVVQGLVSYEELYKEKYGKYSSLKPGLDRAIAYLIKKSQDDNGLIKERSFTGVIGAKLWYADYSLSPQFMTLRALGRYSRM